MALSSGKFKRKRWRYSTEVAFVLLTQLPQVQFSIPDDLFLLEISSLNVAEIHFLHWTA